MAVHDAPTRLSSRWMPPAAAVSERDTREKPRAGRGRGGRGEGERPLPPFFLRLHTASSSSRLLEAGPRKKTSLLPQHTLVLVAATTRRSDTHALRLGATTSLLATANGRLVAATHH